jgi:uncharacterized protein (DUF1015 family)
MVVDSPPGIALMPGVFLTVWKGFGSHTPISSPVPARGRDGRRGESLIVELRPFRGILYHPARVENLFALLAPPYDVISQQERDMYYQQHPYNVVRLIYGKDEAGDTPDDNRYTRAAQYLQTWLREGVLRRDPRPAMYLCSEEYVLPDGTQRERQGLIGLCRLEPYERGIVVPHEETSSAPKRMLFDLRSAVEANLDQVFALYADAGGKLQEILAAQRQQPARLSFRDRGDRLHHVWAISEPATLNEIRRVLADRWALIADGHHRYETCLDYQQLMRQSMPQVAGGEWFNFVMMYLTDIHDPGLTVLPTHRVLRGLSPAFMKQLPGSLRETCELEGFPFRREAERDVQRQRLINEMRRRAPASHVFGLYTGGETFWLLTYRGPLATQTPTAGGGASASVLDVSLLHDELFEKVLGLDVGGDTIAFTEDDAAAVDLVARQEYQAAFLLNPTRVEQVVEQAMAGKRMPRKSTYFYPKLLTGIVMHKEVDDADYCG